MIWLLIGLAVSIGMIALGLRQMGKWVWAGAFVLLASSASAQTWANTTRTPPPPTCCGTCPEPLPIRPFDLGVHGVNLNARAVVHDGAKTYLLVYAAQFPAAALVDLETGLAQIQYPITIADPALRFESVDVLTPRTFLWWHHGAAWAQDWDTTLPWQPMPFFSWR